MFKDNKEDIYRERLKYSNISLMSNKLRIGIIGFGKAGLIKANHFYKQGAEIFVLTKEYNKDIISKFDNNIDVKIGEYNKEFILNKHIIIIAIDDDEVIKNIRNDCEEYSKIYIDSSDFTQGMGVVPVQRESENIVLSINSKVGNPRGAVFVSEKIKGYLEEYDEFIEFTAEIRKKVKSKIEIKDEVLNFIYSEDFFYLFNKKKGKEVIRLFYGEEIV